MWYIPDRPVHDDEVTRDDLCRAERAWDILTRSVEEGVLDDSLAILFLAKEFVLSRERHGCNCKQEDDSIQIRIGMNLDCCSEGWRIGYDLVNIERHSAECSEHDLNESCIMIRRER